MNGRNHDPSPRRHSDGSMFPSQSLPPFFTRTPRCPCFRLCSFRVVCTQIAWRMRHYPRLLQRSVALWVPLSRLAGHGRSSGRTTLLLQAALLGLGLLDNLPVRSCATLRK